MGGNAICMIDLGGMDDWTPLVFLVHPSQHYFQNVISQILNEQES